MEIPVVRWLSCAALCGARIFQKAPIRVESALITMGVSYAYNLATTLYNDVEQRPEMVKQGLTRAGIEKVRSVHTCVLPPTYVCCAFSPFHLPHRCSGRTRSSASRG